MNCSFIVSTEAVHGFNFSDTGVRQAISLAAVGNFITTPNAEVRGLLMVDDQGGDGTWSIAADSKGGVSFAHTSSCNDDFQLEFDLYVKYATSFIGVGDGLGLGSSGDVYVIAPDFVVVVGWVQGVKGPVLGVRSVINFQSGTLPENATIIGTAFNHKTGLGVIQTFMTGYSLSLEGVLTPISQPGNARFFSMQQYHLQTPVLGSQNGGVLFSSDTNPVTSNGFQPSLSFFPATPAGFRVMQVERTGYSYKSFSTSLQPAQQFENQTTVGYASYGSTFEGMGSVHILQKIALYVEQPFNSPKMILQVLDTWTFTSDHYDSFDGLYVEADVHNQGTIVSQIVVKDKFNFGVIDFDTTVAADSPSFPPTSVVLGDTSKTECSLMADDCSPGEVCTLYAYGDQKFGPYCDCEAPNAIH
jgi:hypothetical protein